MGALYFLDSAASGKAPNGRCNPLLSSIVYAPATTVRRKNSFRKSNHYSSPGARREARRQGAMSSVPLLPLKATGKTQPCNRPDRGLHHRSSVAAAGQPRVEMLSQRRPRRCTRVQTRQAPLILFLAIRQCGHRSPVSSANPGRFASDGRLEQARMPVAATLSSFGISRDSCRNSWLPR